MGNVLEIKNVCKTYTSKKGIVYANKDISFDLSENEILAVLGPNGAGKSTLIKQIIGYTIYDSGSIKIKGIEVNKSKDNLLAEIGYMMQSRFEHWDHLSIYDAVYYSARLRKVAKDQAKKEIEYLGGHVYRIPAKRKNIMMKATFCQGIDTLPIRRCQNVEDVQRS